MTTNIEIKEKLVSRLDDLHKDVESIVQRYWLKVLKMESEQTGQKKRNKLRVRSVMDGNSLRAEWYFISWVGKGKDGKYFDKKDSISKPARSFGYTLSKLLKYAHEWEKEIVEETEQQLVGIRQESHHLTRALLSVGFAQQAFSKRPAKP